MKLAKILIVTFAVSLPTALLAQETVDQQATPAVQMDPVREPTDFVVKAVSANMFEIESSKLALTKSLEPGVMDFAQHMIDDHTKAGEGMRAAAEADGVPLVEELAAPEQVMLMQLGSAADFQAAYVEAQLAGHDQAVALYESFVANGPDGKLKDFANATLPTLKEHQATIHQIAGK